MDPHMNCLNCRRCLWASPKMWSNSNEFHLKLSILAQLVAVRPTCITLQCCVHYAHWIQQLSCRIIPSQSLIINILQLFYATLVNIFMTRSYTNNKKGRRRGMNRYQISTLAHTISFSSFSLFFDDIRLPITLNKQFGWKIFI